jgi:hypothetical protein
MKKLLLAGSIFLMAGAAAYAGNLSDPIVTPDVVMDAAIETAGDDSWVGVLMVFLTIVLLGVGS